MERSYLITMCLLIIHQIDAAFWKEWEMFYLPGGVQAYLLFNIIVIPILLLGYRSIIKANQTAVKYSYLCAGLGIVTFTIHAVFLASGYEQFKLPLSLFIICSCLFSSAWQVIDTRKQSNVMELA